MSYTYWDGCTSIWGSGCTFAVGDHNDKHKCVNRNRRHTDQHRCSCGQSP